MKSVVQAIRRMRSSGLLWFIASAVLFLVGAASFNGAGLREMSRHRCGRRDRGRRCDHRLLSADAHVRGGSGKQVGKPFAMGRLSVRAPLRRVRCFDRDFGSGLRSRRTLGC